MVYRPQQPVRQPAEPRDAEDLDGRIRDIVQREIAAGIRTQSLHVAGQRSGQGFFANKSGALFNGKPLGVETYYADFVFGDLFSDGVNPSTGSIDPGEFKAPENYGLPWREPFTNLPNPDGLAYVPLEISTGGTGFWLYHGFQTAQTLFWSFSDGGNQLFDKYAIGEGIALKLPIKRNGAPGAYLPPTIPNEIDEIRKYVPFVVVQLEDLAITTIPDNTQNFSTLLTIQSADSNYQRAIWRIPIQIIYIVF